MSREIFKDVQYLLLVEGQDETQFFIELCSTMFDKMPFQVIEYEGKEKLVTLLQALVPQPNFGQIKHIAIVRDADYETNAFNSVCSAIDNANKANSDLVQLPIPKKHLEAIGEDLRVSILILPPDEQEGMLESVIIKSLQEDEIMVCVNQYFDCLETVGINAKPEPLPKAFLRVYMAALYQAQMRTFIEGKNVDEDATRKDRKRSYLSDIYRMTWWTWEHPVFEPIKEFLRKLLD